MKSRFLAGLCLSVALVLAAPAGAQTTGAISKAEKRQTYTSEEMVATGHEYFGKASRGLAQAVEFIFQSQGEPSAYIVGEEGSAAFIGGLRYGEGTIYYKNGITQHIYWQGPSVGFDMGGNGSRALVRLDSDGPRELYDRFGGVEGSAYLIGGLGVNFQQRDEIILAPIRTGVGARLGANVGYVKYSPKPNWNPF